MDSTPSESIHFSPSIKKTNRSRTPRKSTPSRLYLRQSFPTLESPTSTTPSVSPGKSFIQRQQQLQDARDEQEESNELLSERHTQLNNQKEQHISEETAKERLSDTSELPASSDHVRDTQTNTLTEILKRRQWKPQSQTAAINDTTNPVSVAPRLRTTETEYDLSPTRSLRQLSTPPRSLYIGTPSKAFFDSWEHEDLQESDGSVSSPSDMRKARMMSSNSIFNQRSRLENDYSRKERELSPRYTTQDDTDQEDLVGDVVDQEEEGEEVGPEDKEHDDQGYNYGDDEVSFKRSGPVSSSNHSTLIEQESQNQQLDSLHGDNLQDENYSDHEPSPIKEYTPTQKRQLESSFVSETDAEDSLLEVAEKTTAIAEELRSVYSNLQVLFSPENEAKLNGAVSVLSSQKRSSDRSTIENKSFSASIPKPLVFETSPVTVQKLSTITKRKPAPLRPALIAKQNRFPSREQKQPHQGQQNKKHHQHDVPLRGLISDAESARRLKQYSVEKPSKTLSDNNHEPKSSRIRHKAPEIPNVDTIASGEKHQQHFQKKLDRWKQVELQNQSDAPPLPTYPDLYIPTQSSRSVIHTDTEFEDEESQLDQVAERRRILPHPPDHIYKGDAQQELDFQTVREKELYERKGRRVEHNEDIDLRDRRPLSKRRREAAFWS